jgi:excisionase family DNA binding protein
MRGLFSGLKCSIIHQKGVVMLLTAEEVADRLRVSVKTVRKWVKEGKLKKLPIPGHIRIAEEEFQRFIKGGEE